MAGADGITSDDFTGASLQGFWTEVDTDPTGGAVTFESSNIAILTVPAGTHDTDPDPNYFGALQILQDATAGNTDFEIEAKFTTLPDDDEYKSFGLVVFMSGGERLQLTAHSPPPGGVVLRVSTNDDQSNENTVDIDTPYPTAPFWLRLKRTVSSNTWNSYYSLNGSDFTEITPSFVAAYTVATVGVLAGNYGADVADWESKVDYFQEASDPIGGGGGPTRRVMVVT